ncbi:MAG: alpha-hydroxy acid oxidase, partial [Thalassolituus sp.]
MTHIKKPASATIPQGVISISDYESAARDRMRHDIAEYIYAGSADEQTLYRNRYGFQNYPIYNRVLADFSNADTSIPLFGKILPHPFLLAPVAHQGLVHPDGERATAMAANAMQTPMIISSLSNIPVEQITAQEGTFWFQLYWQGERVRTKTLLEKAIAAGVEAIVITLDAAVSGVRNRAQRAGFYLPETLSEANLTDLPRSAPRTLE